MWFVRFWRLCSFRAPNGNGAGFGDKAPGMAHNRFLKVWGALVGLSFGEPGTAFTFATECGFKSLRFWFVAWCLLKQDSCQRKKIKKKWARIVPIAYSILQLAKIHKSLTSQHRSTQVAYGILICANTDTEPNGGRLCQMWDGPWSAWFRFHGPATQRTLKNDCGASLARSRRVGAALCQWSEGFKYGQVWVKVRWGAQCAPKGWRYV